MLKKIKLNKVKYWREEEINNFGEARLLDIRTKQTVAYVYADGQILQRGKLLGQRQDLKDA